MRVWADIIGVVAYERRPLEKQIVPTSQPPQARASPVEFWLTMSAFVGAGLVYLSLFLQSAIIFGIGEVLCLVVSVPIVLLHRDEIRKWWLARGKCPGCGRDLRGVKGACPNCGRKMIV